MPQKKIIGLKTDPETQGLMIGWDEVIPPPPPPPPPPPERNSVDSSSGGDVEIIGTDITQDSDWLTEWGFDTSSKLQLNSYDYALTDDGIHWMGLATKKPGVAFPSASVYNDEGANADEHASIMVVRMSADGLTSDTWELEVNPQTIISFNYTTNVAWTRECGSFSNVFMVTDGTNVWVASLFYNGEQRWISPNFENPDYDNTKLTFKIWCYNSETDNWDIVGQLDGLDWGVRQALTHVGNNSVQALNEGFGIDPEFRKIDGIAHGGKAFFVWPEHYIDNNFGSPTASNPLDPTLHMICVNTSDTVWTTTLDSGSSYHSGYSTRVKVAHNGTDVAVFIGRTKSSTFGDAGIYGTEINYSFINSSDGTQTTQQILDFAPLGIPLWWTTDYIPTNVQLWSHTYHPDSNADDEVDYFDLYAHVYVEAHDDTFPVVYRVKADGSGTLQFIENDPIAGGSLPTGEIGSDEPTTIVADGLDVWAHNAYQYNSPIKHLDRECIHYFQEEYPDGGNETKWVSKHTFLKDNYLYGAIYYNYGLSSGDPLWTVQPVKIEIVSVPCS